MRGWDFFEKKNLLFLLRKAQGVPYYLLNAKPENAANEAEIVAAGGRLGAVTISTNMAGRGTDIILGGDGKAMARLHLEAALRKAWKQQEEQRRLDLCLPLPEVLQEEMSNAAEMLAANAPEDVHWSLAQAAICDGIQADEKLSKAFQASLNSLKEVYGKACEELMCLLLLADLKRNPVNATQESMSYIGSQSPLQTYNRLLKTL